MDNTDFSSFTSEDFAADESFLNFHFKTDPRDVAFWEKWIEGHREKADDIAEAKRLIDMLVLKLPEPEYREEYEKIQAAIDKKQALPSPYRRSRFTWRVAASVLLLTTISYFTFQYFNESAKKEGIVYIDKINPAGQKSTIFLKDGSKVILNSESSLRFREDFGISDRRLYLQGEAFFEVAKDTALAFEVITANITTTALGTSFNIKAYPEEPQINIALVTGKVKVNHFQNIDLDQRLQSTTLTQGEQVIYQVDENQLKKGKFQAKGTLGWKDGVIYFEDTSFDEAINTLERWYGVRVEIINQTREPTHFSGEFHNESLENVLEAMSYSQKFEYSIDKRNVTLDFNK